MQACDSIELPIKGSDSHTRGVGLEPINDDLFDVHDAWLDYGEHTSIILAGIGCWDILDYAGVGATTGLRYAETVQALPDPKPHSATLERQKPRLGYGFRVWGCMP